MSQPPAPERVLASQVLANASSLVRRRMYTACIYAWPKPYKQLIAEQKEAGLKPEEWCDRHREISREELGQLNFIGTPILMEHKTNERAYDLVLRGSPPRYPAGIVIGQRQDPQDGSLFVDIRCYDTVAGRWMCTMMETPDIEMRGFSLGHRKDVLDNRLLIDEISYCIEGRRPGTKLVAIRDVEYPADLQWSSSPYKPGDWSFSQKPVVQSTMSASVVPMQLVPLATTPPAVNTQSVHPAAMTAAIGTLPVVPPSSALVSSTASTSSVPAAPTTSGASVASTATAAAASAPQTGTGEVPAAKKRKLAESKEEIEQEVAGFATDPDKSMKEFLDEVVQENAVPLEHAARIASLASAIKLSNKRKRDQIDSLTTELKEAQAQRSQLVNANREMQDQAKQQVATFVDSIQSLHQHSKPLRENSPSLNDPKFKDFLFALPPDQSNRIVRPFQELVSCMSIAVRDKAEESERSARLMREHTEAQARIMMTSGHSSNPSLAQRLRYYQEIESRETRASGLVANTMSPLPAFPPMIMSQASSTTAQQQPPQQYQQQTQQPLVTTQQQAPAPASKPVNALAAHAALYAARESAWSMK